MQGKYIFHIDTVLVNNHNEYHCHLYSNGFDILAIFLMYDLAVVLQVIVSSVF